MQPDAMPLTDTQRQALGRMMHAAFVEIRLLGWEEKATQAADLPDAFHNLPKDMWHDEFSLPFFRDAFLGSYQTKYPRNGGFFDYVALCRHGQRGHSHGRELRPGESASGMISFAFRPLPEGAETSSQW